MKKVIILGAGVTGLATGLGLAERGFEPEIYEALDVPGGMAASRNIVGVNVDYGFHIYHTQDDSMKKYWNDIFGDLLVEADIYFKNYKDGIYYDYPLSYESIEKFPAEIRDKVLKELSEVKPEDLQRARNFRECVRALVGPTLQQLFFEGYIQKLWGISADKMSSNWAPKRIEIRKKHSPFWYHQYSAVGKYGSGEIMRRLSDKIVESNGKIFLNHKAKEVNIVNGKIDSILFENGEVIDTKDEIVISTLPLNVLCDLANIKCSLKFNSILVAFLTFNKEYVFNDNYHGVYYAHDDYFFHRVSEQKKVCSLGYPKDKTVLCFEISTTKRNYLAEMSEDELLKAILEQFCSTGLVEAKDYVEGQIFNLPNMNPILEYGYEKELARINSFIHSLKNLHVVGGSAEFVYGDMQVMFSKARDLVDLLSSEHYQINKNIKSGMPFRFNEEVRLFNYSVGGENPSIVIAEIGLNHNGSVEIAKKLLFEAKRCGCEIAKIQTFSSASRVSAAAKSAKYADKTLQMEETTFEMFKRFELSKDDHIILFKYAAEIGIPIISTPFDERSIDLLCELGVKAFKVASADLVNLPFLKYLAAKKRPILLSTGMSSMAEIEEALDTIASEDNPNVILLHCASAYPADASDVNLRAIKTMQCAFKIPVGFSDHTIGPLVSIAAMTLGSHVIERHFTLDRKFEGPDHILSSEPEEMKQLVDDRNIIFSALGTGIKKPSAAEYNTINRHRKSIFTTDPMKKGTIITLDKITIKGPGHGLMPKYLKLILGKKISRDVEADQPLTWDDLLVN